MSKQKKKEVRFKFREDVLRRDGYRCRVCGIPVSECPLDAHHITSRKLMPNGGYCAANGISLCSRPEGCHEKAELQDAGYEPSKLYELIGSSYQKALAESEKLDGD